MGRRKLEGIGLYDYGFRMYDASIGRFTGVDPISDQFTHVSVYNYAENEPVGHIDLWGLQKVRYDINAVNNETFLSAHAIDEQTSGGKKFLKALKSQSKIDVVYAIITQGPADGITAGPFKSFKEFTERRAKSYNLYYSTENNWEQYESYFEEGKELMIISVNCSENSCSGNSIREAAQTINHEEVAHGINRLLGIDKSMSEEHGEYNNEARQLSPDTNDIKNKPKYKNSEAKKQLDEIDKIMENE